MYHTEAIILKKDAWNEADLMVAALTERFGKIRLLAQGARKHGAKLQGHLEPYSLSHLSFVVGRNGYRLIGAELKAFFPKLRGDVRKLAAVAIMVETLDRNLLEESDGAPQYFELLKGNMETLELAARPTVEQLLSEFHVKFLQLAGVFAEAEGRDAAVLYERAGHTITPPRAIFVPRSALY